MKNEISSSVVCFLVVVTTVFAQESVITDLRDGALTWITGGTDAVYRIEWTSSLTNQWNPDWDRLRNIPARAGETITVGVPMFFRVVGVTGILSSTQSGGVTISPLPGIGVVGPQRSDADHPFSARSVSLSGSNITQVFAPPENTSGADGRADSRTPPKGLIAWYKLEGGSVKDASGFGNDGIQHGVVPAPDRRGRADSAMYFNGTNAWIEVKSSALFDNLHEISLALWIRPIDDGRGSIEQNLISKQPSGWLSSHHSPVTSNHGGLFDLNLYMEGGRGQVYFCTQVLPNMTSQGHLARMAPLVADQWQHLAVTVSRAENRLRVYVNGVKADDVVCTDQTHLGHLLSQPNDEPLRIGKRKDADFGPRFFCGWMGDVRIYDRILQDEEVAGLAGRP